MNTKTIPLTIASILTFFLVIWLYKWWHTPNNYIAPLPPNLKLIGVIDLDRNHGIDIAGLKQGDDILVVLDYREFVDDFIPEHPEYKQYFSIPFDLAYYGGPTSDIIDAQSAIWPYLYVISYSQDGLTFQARHLDDAGIHAILTPHLTSHGNHRVLLSDGDTRILYEVKQLS